VARSLLLLLLLLHPLLLLVLLMAGQMPGGYCWGQGA
jgi:hypothetical protein